MHIEVDSHTHSIASGHAYSTIQEMAREAGAKGIKAFAVTDHGPSLEGAPTWLHFVNMKVLPEEMYGVRVIRGIEANIINYSGAVDMPDKILLRMEFVLAGFHDIEPAGEKEHTEAMINALKSPYIDAISHPGNPGYCVDIEKVVKAAKENGKIIEINNASFTVRKGSEANCREFVKECKKQGVRVVCGSDAHVSFDVGKFDKVKVLLEEAGMQEDLVINTHLDKFEKYMLERVQRINRAIVLNKAP